MLEYITAETIAREHMEEVAANLETTRLLQASTSPRRPSANRAIMFMADLFIAIGTRLQNRYQSLPEPEADCVS